TPVSRVCTTGSSIGTRNLWRWPGKRASSSSIWAGELPSRAWVFSIPRGDDTAARLGLSVFAALALENLQAFFQVSPRRCADLKETAAEPLLRLLADANDHRFPDDRPSGLAWQIERDFQPGADRVHDGSADEKSASRQVSQRSIVLHTVPPEGDLPAGGGAVSVTRRQP